jgi:hypothetical protein
MIAAKRNASKRHSGPSGTGNGLLSLGVYDLIAKQIAV